MRTASSRIGTIGIAVLLALVALPTGCASEDAIRVHDYYGSEIKFDGLGPAFSWTSADGNSSGDRVEPGAELDGLVRGEIERQLGTRGFSKTQTGASDFLLDYYIRKRSQTDAVTSVHGVRYEAGSLIVDVIDPANRGVVWRGLAHARLNRSYSPDVRKARINEAVQLIVERFPSKKTDR